MPDKGALPTTIFEAVVHADFPQAHRKVVHDKIIEAFNDYQSLCNLTKNPNDSVSEQRKLLKKLITHADRLNDCIEHLSNDTLFYFVIPRLHSPTPDRLYEQFKPANSPNPPGRREVQITLDLLVRRAESTREYLQLDGINDPKKPALHELVRRLAVIWAKAFPNQKGIKRGGANKDYGSETFQGRQLDFIDNLLKIQKVVYPRSALGKRLYTIMRG